MKGSNKLKILAATTILALAALVLPASAHTAPLVGTCLNGTADVTAEDGSGLTATEDKRFEWEITIRCDTDADTVPDATLDASGLFIDGANAFGRCGRSTATGGSGTLTFDAPDNHTIELFNIGWQSLGTVLAVTGDHDNGAGDGQDHGDIVAEVQASGGEDCVSPGGAHQFTVHIVAELI